MDILSYVLSKKYIEDSLNGAGALIGKSAYEIAVEHGFEGSEQEWLESLKNDISGGFIAQSEEPEDKKMLWIDTDDETQEVEDCASREYVDNAIEEAHKERVFELIEQVETTEEISSFSRNKEPDGTPYNFKRLHLRVISPASESKLTGYTMINEKTGVYYTVAVGTDVYRTEVVAEVRNGALRVDGRSSANVPGAQVNFAGIYTEGYIRHGENTIYDMSIKLVSGNFPVGTTFEIWGVRNNA